MKAARRLADNVYALLTARRLKQTDLANWCHKSDPWVSQFLRGQRNWQLDDLDRVADFFGIATYQLFQPGISGSTERRRINRRTGKERRISAELRVLQETAAEVERVRPVSGTSRHADEARAIATNAKIHRVLDEFIRQLDPLLSDADPRRQTPVARRPQPKARPFTRATGGQDDQSGTPKPPPHK